MSFKLKGHADQRDVLINFRNAEKKLSSEDVEKLAKQMAAMSIRHCIIVSNEGLSTQAEKIFRDMENSGIRKKPTDSKDGKQEQMMLEKDDIEPFRFEHFLLDELTVNITKHELVPRHIPVSDEEKKAVLEKFRVKESQLPKILQTDAVARYLGLRKGQIVKIIRNSETAGLHIAYRTVV